MLLLNRNANTMVEIRYSIQDVIYNYHQVQGNICKTIYQFEKIRYVILVSFENPNTSLMKISRPLVYHRKFKDETTVVNLI